MTEVNADIVECKGYLARLKRFSRCFEAVFCTAIIVLILGQDVDREPVILCDVKVKLWRHLLGYERAGIFCDGERVVVPRLLSHVEDAWDKRFQPARHFAKCITVEPKVKCIKISP